MPTFSFPSASNTKGKSSGFVSQFACVPGNIWVVSSSFALAAFWISVIFIRCVILGYDFLRAFKTLPGPILHGIPHGDPSADSFSSRPVYILAGKVNPSFITALAFSFTLSFNCFSTFFMAFGFLFALISAMCSSTFSFTSLSLSFFSCSVVGSRPSQLLPGLWAAIYSLDEGGASASCPAPKSFCMCPDALLTAPCAACAIDSFVLDKSGKFPGYLISLVTGIFPIRCPYILRWYCSIAGASSLPSDPPNRP